MGAVLILGASFGVASPAAALPVDSPRSCPKHRSATCVVVSRRDTTVRNAPPGRGAGYVIGTARRGVPVQVHGYAGRYSYGLVSGGFGRCGWVFNGSLQAGASGTSSTLCKRSRRYGFKSFGRKRNCEPGNCRGGYWAQIDYRPESCHATGHAGHAYANVDPFSKPATPRDYYGTLPDGSMVQWRYVSRDGRWVMVHDPDVAVRPGFPPDASDWYFVRRRCLRLGVTSPAIHAKSGPGWMRVWSLGDFRPRRNARLAAAIKAFGRPDSREGNGPSSCAVRWYLLGLRIDFANFGNPQARVCSPRYLRAQSVTIEPPRGIRWQTKPTRGGERNRHRFGGLRIGDPVSEVLRRHPRAENHGNSWWLFIGEQTIGAECSVETPCRYPIVEATVANERVASFELWIGAAGD